MLQINASPSQSFSSVEITSKCCPIGIPLKSQSCQVPRVSEVQRGLPGLKTRPTYPACVLFQRRNDLPAGTTTASAWAKRWAQRRWASGAATSSCRNSTCRCCHPRRMACTGVV